MSSDKSKSDVNEVGIKHLQIIFYQHFCDWFDERNKIIREIFLQFRFR